MPRPGAKQASVLDEVAVDLAGALVGGEEHHKEDQHGAEHDLVRGADAEPKHKQRGEGDFWQGIEGQDKRLEQVAEAFDPTEHEPDKTTRGAADHETDARLGESKLQVGAKLAGLPPGDQGGGDQTRPC